MHSDAELIARVEAATKGWLETSRKFVGKLPKKQPPRRAR